METSSFDQACVELLFNRVTKQLLEIYKDSDPDNNSDRGNTNIKLMDPARSEIEQNGSCF